MKKTFWMIVGMLFGDDGNGSKKISLGRVVLVVTFSMATIAWWHDKEIPNTMLTVLMSALGYVLGGKMIDGAKEVFGKKGSFSDNDNSGN